MHSAITGVLCALVGLSACALELDPPPQVVHARFDPDNSVIPMPNNAVRDDEQNILDLPIDEDLSTAERWLYEQLNHMDGWSSASAITIEFDGAIEPSTLNDDTLQVWQWGASPRRVNGEALSVSNDGKKVTIDAPRFGWDRGATYVAVLRGGSTGARGARGEVVECDAAFYFLRLQEALDTAAHERAFPGNSAAERQDNARKLEDLRLELRPYFDFFAGRGLAARDVAALWAFTVTDRVELAMDKASQRMPLPIDLLIDPSSGLIDLPPAAWDSATVVSAKERAGELDGFGTTANPMLQFTAAIAPESLGTGTFELWRHGDDGSMHSQDIAASLLPDHQSVEIHISDLPLDETTTYTLVVTQGLEAADGSGPVVAMPVGHLLRAPGPISIDGLSQVDAVEHEDAIRLERVRADTVSVLEQRGATDVLAAWTFTTMTITDPLVEWMQTPQTLGTSVDPVVERRQSPGAAVLEFPLAIGAIGSVAEVVHGTIQSPVYLDKQTRTWRADGGHEVENIAFTAVVPSDVSADTPVVVFGHAIMTERRMVLALGQALASRGLAAVAIDLPYHGTRTYCWSEGPLTIPNPRTGELTELASPCAGDDICRADGQCISPDGQPGKLRNWPIIPMPMASGAAFLEIEHIANSRDHFRQAQIDLSALTRSLVEGDWKPVFGASVDRTRIYYAGQSLGGILGATFTALEPRISDVVLNVPGADTVDLFRDSPFFGRQIEAFFTREGVSPESFDGHRFLNVARWLMDGVDPHSFADRLVARPGAASPRRVLLQMATLDFIIPNLYTKTLESLSGAWRRDYIAEHGFLVIPIEPEYFRGTRNLADFLIGELNQ